MLKKLCLVLFALLFLTLSVKTSYAARSISITTNKNALFGDEDMVVTASASGFTTGETIYLKGAFYQDGTTNYFGFTKNNDSWIKNGDTTLNQRQILIGSWDSNLNVKADFSDSGYKGEGGYKFKLGFYYLTSGGNLSAVNWSTNVLDVNISEPDPTATTVPTSYPTSTSAPTPTKLPTATLVKTLTPTVAITAKDSINDESKSVDGINNGLGSSTPIPTNSKAEVLGESTGPFPLLFIALGLIFFVACGILAYFQFGERIFTFLPWKKKSL